MLCQREMNSLLYHDSDLFVLLRTLHWSFPLLNNKTIGNVRKRNTEVFPFNNCYSGKTMSITYSECVFVPLGILHAMGMSHSVICCLSGSTKVFHIVL